MAKNSAALDSYDRKLLDLVQSDARLTNEAIGEKVALSPTAVRRRLKRLRDAGIIRADVALLDSNLLGFSVITGLRCTEESREVYGRIIRRMNTAPEVLECYNVSGDVDFIVIAHMRDMEHYNQWMDEYVLGDPDIARCDTSFVYKRTKYETAIPV
ncbi:MAG: Lrp/AsnC family transcriptional regulator [Pseudomonadota bacterium]